MGLIAAQEAALVMGGVLAKCMHDEDNRLGLWVSSRGEPTTTWQAFGDDRAWDEMNNDNRLKAIHAAVVSLGEIKAAGEASGGTTPGAIPLAPPLDPAATSSSIPEAPPLASVQPPIASVQPPIASVQPPVASVQPQLLQEQNSKKAKDNKNVQKKQKQWLKKKLSASASTSHDEKLVQRALPPYAALQFVPTPEATVEAPPGRNHPPMFLITAERTLKFRTSSAATNPPVYEDFNGCERTIKACIAMIPPKS